MTYQPTHQDKDTEEMVELVGTEEAGTVRIRLFDGTEYVLPQAEFDTHFTPVAQDTETEENPDDEIHQRWTRRQAREAARLAGLRAAHWGTAS